MFLTCSCFTPIKTPFWMQLISEIDDWMYCIFMPDIDLNPSPSGPPCGFCQICETQCCGFRWYKNHFVQRFYNVSLVSYHSGFFLIVPHPIMRRGHVQYMNATIHPPIWFDNGIIEEVLYQVAIVKKWICLIWPRIMLTWVMYLSFLH